MSVKAPKLTLPDIEAEVVRTAYGAARTILEYGSGGSTVIAGDVAGATVFSVENDGDWARMMQGWFAENPPKAQVTLHHADLGPTKAWGMPVNNRRVHLWPGYPNSVWDLPGFVAPEVVLIDGRFRLACFLTVLYRTPGPVRVLWDDYTGRKPYHIAERLSQPVAIHGRMAEFHLTPQTLAPGDLGWVAEAFATPQ